MDEAHSSQMGETARELKAILGTAAAAQEADEEPDWEDRLNQVMQSRGRQPNLSFFAFTATPKGKTLELFGRPGRNSLPEAFHLYSMRQAIEDDPKLPKKKAARALARFMSLHPRNLEQKTEVMVEHFRQKVMGQGVRQRGVRGAVEGDLRSHRARGRDRPQRPEHGRPAMKFGTGHF